MSETPPTTETSRAWQSLRWLMPVEPEPLWRRLAIGAALAAIAMIVRLPFEWLLHGSLPYVFIFPALTVAALRGGTAASAAAIVVAIGFFVGEGSTLTGEPAARLLALALFVASCALITAMAEELRRAVAALQAKELALQDSDARLRLLVRELEHRVKNSLQLAGSLVKLTARHSDDVADFRRRFEPRLQALAGAQTLLTQSDWREPDLAALVADALAPFAGPDRHGVDVEPGPAFAVPIASAVSLTLLLHELGANALKHGALAAAGGEVKVAWRLADDGRAAILDWTETCAEPVLAPKRKGFGSELLQVLGGGAVRIERRFERQGVVCRVELRRESS